MITVYKLITGVLFIALGLFLIKYYNELRKDEKGLFAFSENFLIDPARTSKSVVELYIKSKPLN